MSDPNLPEGITQRDIDRIGEPSPLTTDEMKPKIRWKCPKCGAEFCAREFICPSCLMSGWKK